LKQNDIQSHLLFKIDDIKHNLKTKEFTVFDARGFNAYLATGETAEEMAHRGHIPFAKCLPYKMLLNDGTYMDSNSIRSLLEEYQLKDNKLVFSCQTGNTGCVLMLGVSEAINCEPRLYNNSFNEWKDNNVPINQFPEDEAQIRIINQ